MKRASLKDQANRTIISISIFLAALTISALVWRISGGNDSTMGIKVAFWALSVLLAASLTLLYQLGVRSGSKPVQTGDDAARLKAESDLLKRQLDGMAQLNELLIDEQNEEALIEKALAIVSRVAGSEGASFVPYDEWGQPLGSHVYGAYPEPVLKAWSDHLGSPEVRQRCQVCKTLHGDLENACPLLDAPFNNVLRIYCLPLIRNNRAAGIVNLYLKADQEISKDLNKYLVLMLNEMGLAIEIARLRNQELVTLRQLQLAHSQPEELKSIVTRLVDGLREVLDFKHSRAIFRSTDVGYSGLEFTTGDDPWLVTEEATQMLTQVMKAGISSSRSYHIQLQPDGTGRLLLPFCLPEGTIIGAVIMTGARFLELQPRQAALIDTVTMQAALLVENEHRRLETEYRSVMQERVRLAREIHDSLAQTLAYLKLTSAQMQSQLAQGDLQRLGQNLQHSHEALSDAYLETRQAIDNLRFAPQQNMSAWLVQIARNFEQTSGLKVNTDIPSQLPQVSPEVQAQLVRIIQEALSNVRKHSQAASVWINVREWNDELVFDICDDGIGFSADDVPDLSRHGLKGMRERAELIGAEFQITSQPALGTTVHIEVPIRIQETPA